MVVGKGAGQAPSANKPLAPLREAVCGKRPRDDPAVEELFSAKRHAASDAALAGEVRARSWQPSPELVAEVARRGCWASACALLALPELDEDLAVKLLRARPELLARVVRRARASHLLEQALRDNLPASQLPELLEVLLQWLEAYQEFPEEEVHRAAPSLPLLPDIVAFMGALSDGCLPSLARLEAPLLERAVEALAWVERDAAQATRLHAVVREACRIKKPVKTTGGEPQRIEVMRLPF
mmetsp:Transcript_9799/g.30482  ORF Transcript_9799/g.30482 Transcript_9799/m.30482 type:complete len:240 (-) Transcript_9799:90-809(-)